MPTDGGPTNLPMFESFYFEKILFYSNHLIDDDELNNLFIGINIREPQDFYNKLYDLSKSKEIEIIKKAKDFYEKKCSSKIFKANYLDIINDFIKIKNW